MKKPLRTENFTLNPLGGTVTIFTIAEGETIKEGDLVVVNTRTLEASRPRSESGYYAVGRAIRLVSQEDSKSVICRDGIYVIRNTDIPKHMITDSDIGRVCYFDGAASVTMDNINTTKAGEVLGVDDEGRALVKISVSEGSELEW